MLYFETLSEFSRNYCIPICAFLVPCILLTTLQTIILTTINQHKLYIRLSASFATICALAMVFHVFTWFWVGVIMAPTFILLYMATGCLIVNMWAVFFPKSLTPLVGKI